MTDYELNKAIAEALGYSVTDVKLTDVSMDTVIKVNDLIVGPLPNYCRHWAVLMPLVVKHCSAVWLDNNKNDPSVQLDWFGGAKYHDMEVQSTYEVFSEDTQYAIAECLLKVLTNGA